MSNTMKYDAIANCHSMANMAPLPKRVDNIQAYVAIAFLNDQASATPVIKPSEPRLLHIYVPGPK